jgi:hypothetical protein
MYFMRLPDFTMIFKAATIALIVVVFLRVIVAPTFVGSHRSKRNTIFANLKQLQGAKEHWAFEQNRTGNVEVTKENLHDYFKGGWVKPVIGERYVLNTLSNMTEAVLTRRLDEFPKGTILRLANVDGNPACEIVWPNGTLERIAGGIRHIVKTNQTSRQ